MQRDDRQFHSVPEQDQDKCKYDRRRVCTGKGFLEFCYVQGMPDEIQDCHPEKGGQCPHNSLQHVLHG